jgi:CheY-like chemotaxis protein
MRHAAQRASALTKQLLAFSRKQVLQPRVLDLNTVVADMDKMLKRLIGEDIQLKTVLDATLGRVKADPNQIEQVILNLAVNARDAMPRGGKVTIETANAELTDEYARGHAAVRPGSFVMLVVSDTGEGIDEETRGHIFEPFFTTKESGKGTGMGLSTVYGIVKQSGGFIWVYSEQGQGTSFKIYLPRVDEAIDEVETPAASGEIPRGEGTLLLVEDEDMVRSLAADVLKAAGYTVLEAAEGHEALEASGRYDGAIRLMITDVVMPKMSGRELATKLAPQRPEMKVIYMSGYTENAIVHHGNLEPDTLFLQKPFTPDALLRKVRNVLGG